MTTDEKMTNQKWAVLAQPQRYERLTADLGLINERAQVFMSDKEMRGRMMFALSNSIQRNPALLTCTYLSIVHSMLNAYELNLLPDTADQHAYLIPLKVKGIMQAHLWIGYRGMIERAGLIKGVEMINTGIAYRNEVDAGRFQVYTGSNPRIDHEPLYQDDRGEIVAFYAVAWLRNVQRPKFTVMTIAEVEAIRNNSFGKDGDAWKYNFPSMGEKCPIRKLYKTLGSTPEFSRLVEIDTANETGQLAPLTGSQTAIVGDLFSDGDEPKTASDKLAAKLTTKAIDVPPDDLSVNRVG